MDASRQVKHLRVLHHQAPSYRPETRDVDARQNAEFKCDGAYTPMSHLRTSIMVDPVAHRVRITYCVA